MFNSEPDDLNALNRIKMSRRQLLSLSSIVPALMIGNNAQAQTQEYVAGDFWNRPRTVWLKRPATNEEIRSTYWADGKIVNDQYLNLCNFLRDSRMANEISRRKRNGISIPDDWFSTAQMSITLLDILYATNGWLAYAGIPRPIQINSGFRHVVTNNQTEGAKKNSHHIKGGAADIVVPGVHSAAVSSFGVWLRGGGIGWYPADEFTHVDDGQKRLWKCLPEEKHCRFKLL